jgi:hypothetical protein
MKSAKSSNRNIQKVTLTRDPSLTDREFCERVIDTIRSYGLGELANAGNNGRGIAKINKAIADSKLGDSIVLAFDFDWSAVGTYNVPVPYAARLALCLFIPRAKQLETIGDFEEKLNTVWIPTCGPRVGRVVCIWHAVWSMAGIIRFGVMAGFVDRITRAFGW